MNNYTQEEFDSAFPNVASGHKPFGSRVIIQLRSPKTQSKGGIILVTETQETEKWNTQVGIVRSVGPLAFKNRDKMEQWPEGAWANVGSFVRVPKWNQDKWIRPHGDGEVLFVLVNDLDLLAGIECNPLEIKAYI